MQFFATFGHAKPCLHFFLYVADLHENDNCKRGKLVLQSYTILLGGDLQENDSVNLMEPGTHGYKTLKFARGYLNEA